MTGFTASAFLSRNRVSPKEAFEGLELCEGKLSCTVLRGLDGSNPVRLLGKPSTEPILITPSLPIYCLSAESTHATKLSSESYSVFVAGDRSPCAATYYRPEDHSRFHQLYLEQHRARLHCGGGSHARGQVGLQTDVR